MHAIAKTLKIAHPVSGALEVFEGPNLAPC